MKFRGQRSSHIIDLLFVLSLFCVFTVCAFLVVSIGANVYRATAENMENTYSTRTALAYVTEKLRQHDAGSRPRILRRRRGRQVRHLHLFRRGGAS